MTPEETFSQLLGLGKSWRVVRSEFEVKESTFVTCVEETPELWTEESQRSGTTVSCYDHVEPMQWLHLNGVASATVREGRATTGVGLDPELLWRQYIQLTDVEEAFRVLKSHLSIRPIWHRLDRRVEAHIMIAFLGYCLWVCLKQRLRGIAASLTPAQVIESLSTISMVEVWFDLRRGGRICLPGITEPEDEQAIILHRLGWKLP